MSEFQIHLCFYFYLINLVITKHFESIALVINKAKNCGIRPNTYTLKCIRVFNYGNKFIFSIENDLHFT